MNIKTLEENQYQIIEGTQSDGRCFSASVYYDLFNKKANDEELNNFIQQYIIKPILDTEKSNCPKFLQWATIWTGIHNKNLNDSNFFTTISEEIILLPEIENIIDLLQKLINLQDNIKGFNGNTVKDIVELFQNLMAQNYNFLDNEFVKKDNKVID